MGLRATVAAGIDQAFIALDDLVRGISVVKETSTADPDNLTVTKNTTGYPVTKAALVRFKTNELGLPLNGERGALLANRTVVEGSDLKCIFRQNELPAGIAPNRSDYITEEEDDKRWNIIEVVQDPAKIVWILQLRMP